MSIFSRKKPRDHYDKLPPKVRRKIFAIQSTLSPDLLKKPYILRDNSSDLKTITRGHCYAATEAAFHLFGKDAGYVPYCYRFEDETTHWWLVNEGTGDIIDPTFPQLGGDSSVYSRGARQSFLTKSPSKRAREIIRRLEASGNYKF